MFGYCTTNKHLGFHYCGGAGAGGDDGSCGGGGGGDGDSLYFLALILFYNSLAFSLFGVLFLTGMYNCIALRASKMIIFD